MSDKRKKEEIFIEQLVHTPELVNFFEPVHSNVNQDKPVEPNESIDLDDTESKSDDYTAE